jgi:hypothetical protein
MKPFIEGFPLRLDARIVGGIADRKRREAIMFLLARQIFDRSPYAPVFVQPTHHGNIGSNIRRA